MMALQIILTTIAFIYAVINFIVFIGALFDIAEALEDCELEKDQPTKRWHWIFIPLGVLGAYLHHMPFPRLIKWLNEPAKKEERENEQSHN